MTRARDLAAFVSNADGDIKFDTDTLFIDSSANKVGIGTTTVSDALHIAATDPAIRFEDTSSGITGHSRIFTDNNNAMTFDIDAGNNRGSTSAQFKIDGTEAMRIDDSGNVLIGTTNTSTIGTINKHLVLGSTTNNDEVAMTLNVMEGTNGRRVKFFLDDDDGVFGVDSTASTGVAPFVIRSTGNERVRFLSGGGITFNGDTAAANALDDYEEGTWTATSQVGSLTAQVTPTYTKIGDLVTIYFDLRFFTDATSTDPVKINGLPFASTKRSVGALMFRYWDTEDDGIVAYVDASLSSILFIMNSSANWNPLDYQHKNGGSAILAGTITYKVS